MKLSGEMIRHYLDACAGQKKLDAKTIKAYRIDLRQFMEFLAGQPAEFGREIIKAYLFHLNETYLPRTVKRKIASLRAFTTWLLDEKLLSENPFAGLRIRVQEPMLLPKTIPLREIEHLLETAHQNLRMAPENKTVLCETAVMELLFATGLRVSELCSLKTWDVDLTDGVIRVLGKGSKERVIQIVNKEVLTLLRQYLHLCAPERNGAFFLNRRGKPLSDQSVRRILRKYAKMAGISMRITPHMFRHSLATFLLDADVDIRYIQQLLGHASILTTQIYTHVAGARQREILMKSHPRNQFSFQDDEKIAFAG